MGKQHAHKYKRIFLDRKKEVPAWRCMLPGCSHYARREFFEGKVALCWRCNNEFVIQEKHARLVKPTCCSKEVHNIVVELAKDVKDLIPADKAKAEELRDLRKMFRSLPDAEVE